jgi:hypothetical protein
MLSPDRPYYQGERLVHGFLIILAGWLLFAHGCHGPDVDDELAVPADAPPHSARSNDP